MSRWRSWLGVLVLLTGAANAHRPSDAFLTLAADGSRVQGRLEVALRDLAVVAPLDADRDLALSWGEVRAARGAIDALVAGALAFSADGRACAVVTGETRLNDRLDGRYAWIPLEVRCPAAPARLRIGYDLLFGVDPTHRGLLALEAGGQSHAGIFSPEQRSIEVTLAEPSGTRVVSDYLREGVHHIWIGVDHVLFLLVLLLPCVLRRDATGWHAVERLPPALWNVAGVVTTFTLAHSVTLALAAFNLVRLPSALVESAIALSVLLAALNNVRPVVTRGRWGVAFGFGLLHGFGFASVLGEVGLPAGARSLALLAFNLGVELGQLAIVVVVVPLAFALRGTAFYRRGVLAGGSLAIAALAAVWLADRSGLAG